MLKKGNLNLNTYIMKSRDSLMFYPKMSNGDDLEKDWPSPHLDHVSIPACIQTLLILL